MKMLKTNLFNNIFKAASLLVCAALVACSGVNGVSDRDESSSSTAALTLQLLLTALYSAAQPLMQKSQQK